MENWRLVELLRFSTDGQDAWTVDDAMKGTSIIGGTGSGKTSASGKIIARKFLKEGWGGLVLCAKTDEADLWEQYCKETGRLNDRVVFRKGATRIRNNEVEKLVFNPLDYEMTREGKGAADPFNIVNIFMTLNKMANRASGESDSKSQDRFWDLALKRILSRTVELLTLAGEQLTYKNMVNLIYSAPTEHNPFDSEKWIRLIKLAAIEVRDEEDEKEFGELNTNYFLKCLAAAYDVIKDDDETTQNFFTFDTIHQFFTSSLPNMSEHTHNAVIESFMGIVEPFLSGILFEHFSGKTTLRPEEVFTENKIIILDFPVKEFLDVGIMAQGMFKLIFQQAIERRDTDKYPKPVFLWADEAQYFINPYDQIFLTTARASRTATVFLSQNIPNYLSAMGTGPDAKHKVDSLMGNLSTKIFHANSDSFTNEYASKMIGQAIGFMSSGHFSKESGPGLSASYHPQIQSSAFTVLKTGGKSFDFDVEGVVFATGRRWSNGKNYLTAIFPQNFSDSEKR